MLTSPNNNNNLFLYGLSTHGNEIALIHNQAALHVYDVSKGIRLTKQLVAYNQHPGLRFYRYAKTAQSEHFVAASLGDRQTFLVCCVCGWVCVCECECVCVGGWVGGCGYACLCAYECACVYIYQCARPNANVACEGPSTYTPLDLTRPLPRNVQVWARMTGQLIHKFTTISPCTVEPKSVILSLDGLRLLHSGPHTGVTVRNLATAHSVVVRHSSRADMVFESAVLSSCAAGEFERLVLSGQHKGVPGAPMWVACTFDVSGILPKWVADERMSIDELREGYAGMIKGSSGGGGGVGATAFYYDYETYVPLLFLR